MHFYDGIEPLTETEKRAVAEAPDIDAPDARVLARPDGGGRQELVELMTRAVAQCAWHGQRAHRRSGSNVIPASATATIDMRLVKGIHAAQTAQRVIDHVRTQGFFVLTASRARSRMAHPKVALVTVEPGGYNAVRTSMDLPISQQVLRTVERRAVRP